MLCDQPTVYECVLCVQKRTLLVNIEYRHRSHEETFQGSRNLSRVMGNSPGQLRWALLQLAGGLQP
jgi:hypothetical protein